MFIDDPRIQELNEVVGNWEIRVDRCQYPLKVKVLKLRDGKYIGIANLEVKGKGCADYYRSIHTEDTREEALENAVEGFFSFWDPETSSVQVVKEW